MLQLESRTLAIQNYTVQGQPATNARWNVRIAMVFYFGKEQTRDRWNRTLAIQNYTVQVAFCRAYEEETGKTVPANSSRKERATFGFRL